MNYLLDTCVISEVIRPSANKKVIEWLNAQEEFSLYLSVITLGELEKGIERLESGVKRSRIESWLRNDLVSRFEGRILPIESSVAMEWGQLQAKAERSGKPLPTLDCFIVATALVHDLKVVTRDVEDMQRTGVSILNPWA
jgi:toxin FitB